MLNECLPCRGRHVSKLWWRTGNFNLGGPNQLSPTLLVHDPNTDQITTNESIGLLGILLFQVADTDSYTLFCIRKTRIKTLLKEKRYIEPSRPTHCCSTSVSACMLLSFFYGQRQTKISNKYRKQKPIYYENNSRERLHLKLCICFLRCHRPSPMLPLRSTTSSTGPQPSRPAKTQQNVRVHELRVTIRISQVDMRK